MTKPLTQAQKAWNNASYRPRKASPKPKGKLAPRSCHPMVIGAAENSTGPSCVVCLEPRDRRSYPVCDKCAGGKG